MHRIMFTIEAYVLLIAHDLFMARHDFEELCRRIRQTPLGSKCRSQSCTAVADSAFSIACALYPKQVFCLQRSAVLVRMLRARGIAAKMVIGTQTLPFRAHAWVEIEGTVFNDHLAARETFQILEVL
jgi:hypothetical protein